MARRLIQLGLYLCLLLSALDLMLIALTAKPHGISFRLPGRTIDIGSARIDYDFYAIAFSTADEDLATWQHSTYSYSPARTIAEGFLLSPLAILIALDISFYFLQRKHPSNRGFAVV